MVLFTMTSLSVMAPSSDAERVFGLAQFRFDAGPDFGYGAVGEQTVQYARREGGVPA